MSPLAVTAFFTLRRRWRLCGIALQPSRDFIMKILFAPDHTGEGLALDILSLLILTAVLDFGIEFVCLFTPQNEDFIEVGKRWIFEPGSKPQPQLDLGS